jgi:hypothetical protein
LGLAFFFPMLAASIAAAWDYGMTAPNRNLSQGEIKTSSGNLCTLTYGLATWGTNWFLWVE